MQVAAILAVACCALLVHGAAVVWLNVKRRGMVEISNDKADEIMLVIGELRMMSDDVPGNRAANMRRRGVNIIKYLTKKKDGKKKEIVYPSRNDRTDDCQ